jgi:serine/threonine-protein kinase
MREVRHPHLLSVFGAWSLPGQLVIAMELAQETLRDRLLAAQGEGLTGIPRSELLTYFAEAAKALDFLNSPRHRLGDGTVVALQHRDIKPENLLLLGGGIKVGDYGLVNCLKNTSTGHSGMLTVAYSAPEFFADRTTRQSDQYSLAVSYCELRTGLLPFRGSYQQMLRGHLDLPPDLDAVPSCERPTLVRALAKKPEERWPSCGAFVDALQQAEPESAELVKPVGLLGRLAGGVRAGGRFVGRAWRRVLRRPPPG